MKELKTWNIRSLELFDDVPPMQLKEYDIFDVLETIEKLLGRDAGRFVEIYNETMNFRSGKIHVKYADERGKIHQQWMEIYLEG